jgi:hypothetical protein
VDNQKEPFHLDWALKAAGLFLASLYSVGFLVVARHLSRYGVSTFSLLQTQYLVAGIWTVGPPVAYGFVQRTVERFKDKAYSFGPPTWRRYILVFVASGLAFGLLFAASAMLLDFKGFSVSPMARLWLCYLLLMLPGDLAWMSWRVSAKAEYWWLNRHLVPFYLTIFVLAIILYALVFATSFYPLIPASLGGGMPRTIIFIPTKDGLPPGITKDNSSNSSIPYKLLTATDRSYVVIAPISTEESIEIGRDAVTGIVVLKDVHSP